MPEGSHGGGSAGAPIPFDLKWVLNALLSPANPVIVGLYDAAGNRMPSMDVAARPGFVDVIDRAARLLGIIYGNVGQIEQIVPADGLAPGTTLTVAGFNFVYNGVNWDMMREGNLPGSILADVTNRPARLLGIVYGQADRLQQSNLGDAHYNPDNALEVASFPLIWDSVAGDWNRWREGSQQGVPQVEVIIRNQAGTYFAEVDPLGYLVTMDLEHHKVHEADFYTVSDYDNNVQIAAPKYWHIITPDTAARFHLKINIESDTGCLLEFFENPTTTNNGVALPSYNNDRNSGNTTTFNFYRDPTVTLDGTRIQVARVGAGREKKIGGTARSEAEWILMQNEQYLVKVTVDANGADVTINIEGYEV